MQRRSLLLVFLSLAASTAIAACSGGAGPSATAPVEPATPAPTAPPTGITLGVANDPTAGDYLTGRDGLALYIFTKDDGTTSACYEECATAWPPLLQDDATPVTAGEGVGGSLGTTSRTDGTIQVTYEGAPLYYFQGDAAAGDTNGEGLNDVWFLATP